jgi:hypothetical protein
MYGGLGGTYRVMGGGGNMKTKKRRFQGTRWRWEDNVQLDLKESDWEVMG